MNPRAILRKAVGSPSRQLRRSTASDDAVEFTSLKDLSLASQERIVPAHSIQDEPCNYDNVGDAEPLTHPQLGSLTASGYTRVQGDRATSTTKRPIEGEMSSEVGSNGRAQHHQGFLFLLKAWWQETACCLLAIGLFIGLVVLLNHYNGRENPEWASNFSLNTVVAVIATLCRALTVIPISEGLSQLKWNSFARKERPLSDLYSFDQASRGPFGSLKLILRTRGRLLGISTLAAAVLVSGLATSSLTQAAISDVPPPERIVSGATAKKAIDPQLDDHQREIDIETIMYSTVMTREKSRRKRIFQQLQPQCPAGDCRWDRFNSLAVCATTKNRTSELEVSQLDIDRVEDVIPKLWISGSLRKDQESQAEFYNVSLRAADTENEYSPLSVYDGNWLNTESPYLALGPSPDYTWATSSILEEGDPPHSYVARHDLIYKVQGQPGLGSRLETYQDDNSPYRAVQIAWYWCVHSYDVNVSAGVPHTELAGEHTNARESEGQLILTSEDSEEEFAFTPHEIALEYLVWNWTDVMTTHHFLGTLMIEGISNNDGSGYYFPGWENTMLKNLLGLGQDVGLALTNYYRDNEEKKAGTVRGRASIGNPIVVIHWPRLSLLGAQILLTIFLLVYVIVDTARTGVDIVKSSNFAELMALEKRNKVAQDDAGEDILSGGITAELEKGLRARLFRDAYGWSLDVHRPGSAEKPSGLVQKIFG